MEILKYLDVLIGLAVVMVLLSPLVSGFTQFWMWVSNARATRLKVGLTALIQQLDTDTYESFEAIAISGLAPGALVTFQQPAGVPPIVSNAGPNGDLVLTQNVAAMLRLTGGNFFNSAAGLPALGVPAGAPRPEIQLWARGTAQIFRIVSAPTDAEGNAPVSYRFSGPAQFSSYQGTATVPPDHILAITIASGDFQGTPVDWDPLSGRFSYRGHMRPVPASHDLNLHLSRAGLPVPSVAITLTFDRNAVSHPVLPPVTWKPGDADRIAGAVLLHPMIAQPAFMGIFRKRRGEVVEREELIRILLEFAAKPAAPEQERLRQIVALDGVPDPSRAMADIRAVALELELTEPAQAAHERISKAILTSARSSFVGRINNWFDQIMERTIVEYRFRAQLVTILGAALVATFVQLDSIDLLKRLSADDKLRDSLVAQAEQQQKNLEEQARLPLQDQDEIQLAKARREEIQTNLTKLRDPQLGVLPDHFIWQPLPRARLIRNPDWEAPYSKRMELVAGAGVYPLEPKWSADLLADIQSAIQDSGAPVEVRREKGPGYAVRAVTGADGVSGAGQASGSIENLHVRIIGASGASGFSGAHGASAGNGSGHIGVEAADLLTHVNGFAQAAFKAGETQGADVISKGEFELTVGYEPPVKLKTTDSKNLKTLIEESSAAVSTMRWPTLRAVKHDAPWIYLRRRPVDPGTNILQPTEIAAGSGHFDTSLIKDDNTCEVERGGEDPVPTPCNLLVNKLKELRFDVEKDDELVITSQRLGALQLRYVPAKPDTNMLINDPLPWISFDYELLSTSWRGVVLTWILLSLGAPFWYDALKDLLKLRSSLAKQEEVARNDRKSNTAPAASASPGKAAKT